ncbi:hypothetical protein AAZX31_15G196700 [Glycine max]
MHKINKCKVNHGQHKQKQTQPCTWKTINAYIINIIEPRRKHLTNLTIDSILRKNWKTIAGGQNKETEEKSRTKKANRGSKIRKIEFCRWSNQQKTKATQ